ncbi:PAS domain-containing protein [Rhizobium herbae]|uniref:histidine kinase n=1 Tax=Rhizobium herbae TaxID=508661 RepID=A0ABS7HE24_9HYPH|nr:PAS domain-containing protein [Rhizobium herbae]MBW9064817.1 PAS domain-containing protein [Rhizobium herbae]
MMSVWSHRPQFLHLGLFSLAYVLGCGFAQSLAIVPGTGISIWPPGGLFMATLILAPRRGWPWWLLVGCASEMFSNAVWFHSPLPAAFLIYVANALEAMTGAWLIERALRGPARLESLPEVLAFVGLGAGVAPIVGASVGSVTLAWFGIQSQTFTAAWPLWWIGDATGVLIVAPLMLVALQNWRGKDHLSTAQWMEFCVLGLIFLGVAAFSLSGYLPFAYIIMPPLLWVAVRFEFKGAVVTLILLALVTAVFTLSGTSQFAGSPEAQREKQIMLQLFLAVSALSALIVAAISRQYQLALLTVRESEHRLQQLIDAVPALIWCTTPQGIPCYLNKQVMDVTGVTLKDLIAPDGSRSLTVVHPDDRVAMDETFARSFETGESLLCRYRQRRANGPHRWVESRAEPLRNEFGAIVQWYGVSVDIEDMVRAQDALQDRERELSQLVDMVPSHVWRLSPDGELSFFNKRMVDFLGLNAAEMDKPGMNRLDAFIETVVHPADQTEFRSTLRQSLATGGSFAMRYRLRRADSCYRWMSSRAEPMRDQAGCIIQWYGICHDIDDQMRAEEALRQSEQQLALLVDVVPVAIASLTRDGEPTFFNKRLSDFLGIDVADTNTPGMTRLAAAIAAAIHPEDSKEFGDELNRCLVTGESFSRKYRLRRADGAYRWMEGRAEPLRDQGGAIVQWYAVALDIEVEVRAQEALRERQRELTLLVDMVPVHIARMAPDGEPTFFSKRTLESLGLENVAGWDNLDRTRLSALIGQVVHPEDGPRMKEVLGHALLTGEPYTIRYRRRRADGAYRWMEGRAEPLRNQGGEIVQWYAAAIDIDDEVRAQQALRERERELSQLVSMVPSLLWRLSPDGEPTFFNSRLVDFLGLDLADLKTPSTDRLAAIIEAAVHPDDADDLGEALNRSLTTGKSFSKQYRLRRADGVYRWMQGNAEPLRDESGRIVQWFGLSHDIDDQLRVQEALREKERALWQIVETLPAMIDCAAPDGEPVYRNPRLRDFLGYKLEELDGTGKSRLEGTLDAGVHPDEVTGVKEDYAYSLATGEPYARRHRLRRFDGEYRWVETRAAPMRDDEGTIVQWNVICLDIDGEVRAEERLRLAQESLARASQAASLAELSASIAHEVNQPLAAVVANSHACHRWLTAAPPNIERAQRTVERIVRDANSAADVVSRIRALFKQSAETRTVAALSDVVNEAHKLMTSEALRRRVRMDVNIDNGLPDIVIDRVQIQQVLVNLMRNGMEAMDTISSDKVLGIRVRRTGDLIQTEISDRGPGIEFPEKMFEAFFTTKEDGLGMGLAICRSNVESHGGRLWAEQNGAQGATFIFTLPAEAKAAP